MSLTNILNSSKKLATTLALGVTMTVGGANYSVAAEQYIPHQIIGTWTGKNVIKTWNGSITDENTITITKDTYSEKGKQTDIVNNNVDSAPNNWKCKIKKFRRLFDGNAIEYDIFFDTNDCVLWGKLLEVYPDGSMEPYMNSGNIIYHKVK